MTLVRRDNPEVHLVLVGSGPLQAEPYRRAALRPSGGGVHVTGQVPDFRPYLQAAAAFVLPSWAEGLPNALLEAMAAGLPCIATPVSGNVEAIEQNATGLLVAPGAPRELAAAVGKLLGGAPLRATLGLNARQRAQRAYPVSRMVTDYRSLLAQLVAGAGIPAALAARLDRAA